MLMWPKEKEKREREIGEMLTCEFVVKFDF